MNKARGRKVEFEDEDQESSKIEEGTPTFDHHTKGWFDPTIKEGWTELGDVWQFFWKLESTSEDCVLVKEPVKSNQRTGKLEDTFYCTCLEHGTGCVVLRSLIYELFEPKSARNFDKKGIKNTQQALEKYHISCDKRSLNVIIKEIEESFGDDGRHPNLKMKLITGEELRTLTKKRELAKKGEEGSSSGEDEEDGINIELLGLNIGGRQYSPKSAANIAEIRKFLSEECHLGGKDLDTALIGYESKYCDELEYVIAAKGEIEKMKFKKSIKNKILKGINAYNMQNVS